MVVMLLRTGLVDINHEVFEVVDNRREVVGWRAIDAAAKHNHVHIVHYLLHFCDYDVFPHDCSVVYDNDGSKNQTKGSRLKCAATSTIRALELAVLNNSTEMVRLLLDVSPDLIGYLT